MNIFEVTVLQEFHGRRADVFLSECEELESVQTRSAAQKLLAEGNVTINGKIIAKNHRVNAGDILLCQIPASVPYEAAAEDIPLSVVYDDADLLVINKPRGLVVHAGAGHLTGTLVNALLYHCGDSLSGIGGVMRPGIVHRLDKDTSGLMVVAKNDIAHQALAAQLADRTMGRVYNAICYGVVKQDRMKIDLPIGRHSVDRKKMAVVMDLSGRGRRAVTYVDVLERFKAHTLISAKLETGRTHQIRVHMAHVGYPVLGDEVYSGRKTQCGGQVLHAKEIYFIHPRTGYEVRFEVDLPDYFTKHLQFININR